MFITSRHILRHQVSEFKPEEIKGFMHGRQLLYVVEVKDGKAILYNCYKDNEGNFYYCKCEEMKKWEE